MDIVFQIQDNMRGRGLQKCSNCAIESFLIANILSEL